MRPLRAAAVALLAAASTIALLATSSARPTEAVAADCTVGVVTSFSNGALLVLGGSCNDIPEVAEEFAPRCQSGAVFVRYQLQSGTGTDTTDTGTGVPCAATRQLEVRGLAGPDRIDLSLVTATLGFTGMTGPNLLRAGTGADIVTGSGFADQVPADSGDDTIFVRDGVADAVSCDEGADTIVADRASLDAFTSCETVDALPEPAAAGAKKKCRKKAKKGGAAAAAKKKCKAKKKDK